MGRIHQLSLLQVGVRQLLSLYACVYLWCAVRCAKWSARRALPPNAARTHSASVPPLFATLCLSSGLGVLCESPLTTPLSPLSLETRSSRLKSAPHLATPLHAVQS